MKIQRDPNQYLLFQNENSSDENIEKIKGMIVKFAPNMIKESFILDTLYFRSIIDNTVGNIADVYDAKNVILK